jgi:hypothetical protein
MFPEFYLDFVFGEPDNEMEVNVADSLAGVISII